MNRILTPLLTATLALSLAPSALFAGAKVIYGDDNRDEYYEASAARQKLARSVVSLWKAEDMQGPQGDLTFVQRLRSKYTLNTKTFTQFMEQASGLPLCPNEPFREQPTGAFCSGTLVGRDLVMTAGHCITSEEDCKNTRFVFGFAVKKKGGSAPAEVPATEVYSCSKIEVTKLDSSKHPGIDHGLAAMLGVVLDQDYAIVRLDRKVLNHRPLKVNKTPALPAGAPLFVIGHPSGLPMKIADDATVKNPGDGENYFEANLDTYGGNSGSAVFNAKTNLIEGILVRGDQDFKKGPADCVVSNVLPQSGGGEAVTKLNDTILSFIPKRLQKEMEEEEATEVVDMPAPGQAAETDQTLGKYKDAFR
jgi:V8-like Glu-specific endopeptidase